MALTDGNDMVMPVAPVGGNSGFGGNMGDNGWWIILLFILLGGFGRGYGYGGNGETGVQAGFNQAALTSGLNDIQTSLCNGFAGVTQAVSGGFAQAEIANNARQMATLQQMNALGTQFQNCCCENRLGLANLQATVLAENCADRAAVSDGIRDIITTQNANTQRILDQICADKIDAKNERIAELQQQLYMRDLAASQAEQTATIQAGQRALANEVEQYVLPTPRPAYIVANPNCCQQFGSCACGA